MLDQNSATAFYQSQLENSEAFNKTVLEASPDCLKILDIEGRLQFMNYNGLCEMEIDNFDIFKNQLWWDLWGNENKDLVQESVDKALKGEANEFTAFCNTAKGTPKWWHVSVIPVRSGDGSISQVLSVSRNITAEKNAQLQISELNELLESKIRSRTEELLERNIDLEKTNSELAMFNHIISHDLQEPLRKIQLFCNQILHDKNADATVKLNRILESVQRLRDLIDALNKFSVSKNAKIKSESFDLNTVFEDVTEHLRDVIDDKKAILDIAALPVVSGSKILITQVFINLVENALKYSKSGITPKIKITADPNIVNEKGEAYCAISIEDNGIGFDNRYAHQIFETFKRLHSKDKYRGTGIGLAICKTVVENHNGWIEVTSEPNVGSKFTTYLPTS